jgi:hypothetical protein
MTMVTRKKFSARSFWSDCCREGVTVRVGRRPLPSSSDPTTLAGQEAGGGSRDLLCCPSQNVDRHVKRVSTLLKQKIMKAD